MQHDIVIIGGGLVGSALARNLAIQGISALVLDNLPTQSLYNAALDNRGIALSYSSIQILDSLGIWPTLLHNAHAIDSVHISEQGKFGFTKLECATYKLPALGYVISASDLGRSIVENLVLNPSVKIMRPVQVEQFNYDPAKQWEITVNGRQIHAKLLIAADGSNSQLRKYCNAINVVKNYDQTAIVCNILTKDKISRTAFERFTSQGVLALLPFGPKSLKCVFTVANKHLDYFLALENSEYIKILQKLIGYRAGMFVGCSERKTFPLHQLLSPKVTAPGAIFIGNAANTLHPVAAQGLNLGLRDVMHVTRIIKKYQNDLTNQLLFDEYDQLRSADHSSTQHFTNSIVEMFGSNYSAITMTRNLGLLAAQFLPGMRARLIAQGVGTWH